MKNCFTNNTEIYYIIIFVLIIVLVYVIYEYFIKMHMDNRNKEYFFDSQPISYPYNESDELGNCDSSDFDGSCCTTYKSCKNDLTLTSNGNCCPNEYADKDGCCKNYLDKNGVCDDQYQQTCT
jgi:hypothetical protein